MNFRSTLNKYRYKIRSKIKTSLQHLRSARCHQLSVLRVRRSIFETRASSVAGPTVWNSLPDHLRDPAVDSEQFRRDLKTYLFAGRLKR